MKIINKLLKAKSSILVQLLFFTVLAAVFPLLVSTQIFISGSADLLKNNLLQLNMTLADNTAQWVLNYENTIKREVEAVAKIQLRTDITEHQKFILSNIILSNNNYIDIVWIRRKNSQVYNNTNREIPSQLTSFIKDKEKYRSILAGNIYITNPIVLNSSDKTHIQSNQNTIQEKKIIGQNINSYETVIFIGYPLWEKGQPSGVLYAEANLTPLRHYISAMTPPRKGTEFFIVDRKGRVIAHQNESLAIKLVDFSHLEAVKKLFESQALMSNKMGAMLGTDRAEVVTAPDGRSMLANIKLIKAVDWGRDAGKNAFFGWGIIAQEPKEYAFFPISKMYSKMKLYGSIAIFLAIALAAFLSLKLSKPIVLLTHGAERITTGDYDVIVNIKSRNEIGILADTFNNMTNKLKLYLAELKQNASEIKDLFFSSMETIVAAIDARDPYTRGHSLRVTSISVAIGHELNLSDNDIERLRIAAMLHDVGKIGIRDDVLLKKGKLTKEEFAVMKTHPVLGATIMEPIKRMANIIPSMKYHHEWWDGTGYPEGLKNFEIPLFARIIAIADTFDAMTSDRPYQKKMDKDFVVNKIKGWAGNRYDPDVVTAFLRVYEKDEIVMEEEILINGIKL